MCCGLLTKFDCGTAGHPLEFFLLQLDVTSLTGFDQIVSGRDFSTLLARLGLALGYRFVLAHELPPLCDIAGASTAPQFSFVVVVWDVTTTFCMPISQTPPETF